MEVLPGPFPYLILYRPVNEARLYQYGVYSAVWYGFSMFNTLGPIVLVSVTRLSAS